MYQVGDKWKEVLKKLFLLIKVPNFLEINLTMKKHFRKTSLVLLMVCGVLLGFSSCKKDKNYTVTVGVFQLSNGTYTDTGNSLTFVTQDECQTWSRTAQADNHSSSEHLHYNAAINVSYDESSKTVTWTEFGPELDQASIDNTCAAAVDGVTKSVNDTDYFVDKNIYLKITNVVENE